MLILFFSLLIFLLSVTSCQNRIETGAINNGSIVRSEDISTQQIRSFAEDEFGYMWIGTMRGVNKYNGYNFLQYYHTEDSTSLSNNQVMHLFSDSRGRLWIGTRQGINYVNKQGVITRVSLEDKEQNILNIRETDNGRIFINTSTCISEYDREEDKFYSRVHLSENTEAPVGFFIDKGNRLWSVGYHSIQCYNSTDFDLQSSYPIEENKWIHYAFYRNNGELWLAMGNNLVVLDTKSSNYVPAPSSYREHKILSTAVITLIHPYDDASLLINTHKDGLFLLNTYTDEVIHQSENNFPFNVPDTEITTMYTDSNKNLWIGSYDQGFFVNYSYQQRFNTNDYLRSQTKNKSIVSVATDKKQNLWIATRTHGLMVWNKESQRICTIDTHNLFPDDLYYKNRVNAIFVDSKNRIWLQTDGRLTCCRYKEKTLVAEKTFYLHIGINAMAEDHQGSIWFAGENENLYILKEGAADFEIMPLYTKGFNFTNGLIMLSSGKLLVASFKHDLQLIDPVTKVIEKIEICSKLGEALFIPSSLYEDSEGDIWIPTIGTGLFRYRQHSGEIEKIENISCNEVSSIIEDVQGNIWIGTLYGLSKYDRTINQITNYYAVDGIGGNQFNERSVCRLADNVLVFGGTHGITFFDPIDVSVRRKIPLYMEELRIHNQLINPVKGGSIETAMLLNPEIRLEHSQNSIQISYSALDYSEFPRVQYAYKLEGFDKQWVEVRNYREAFYSNLPSGDYVFRVRANSHDNMVGEVSASVPIHIARAPWLSIPAHCLYVLLIFGLIWLFFHMYNRILQSRHRTQQALQEKEHEKYLNQMNMNFFANMSHEFRTPLTMISGPIATLCRDESIPEKNKQLLFIMQRNVRRMLRLINQILDFNKLENDALKLKAQRIDSIEIVNRIVGIFKPNAEEKNIALNTYGLEDKFISWIDTDKLEKIMVNLLSNAFKFSHNNGTIEVRYDVISQREAGELLNKQLNKVDSDYIKITVADTGPGIPADKLEDIFKRYYQLDRQVQGYMNWGTGIGLYFSRRLAELHHGHLFTSNRENEQGAVFTLLLPTNETIYTSSEKEDIQEKQAYIIPDKENDIISAIDSNPAGEDSKVTLLVVDDDTEITRYLRELLSSTYKVVSFYDAESAWNAIEETSPDLILSDVIMPGIDGYDFCKRIKGNISTSHIPVILLTAKVAIDDQVEGLNVGANAYVTKPFDPSYLTALIKSQLLNRDNVRRQLSDVTETDSISDDLLSPQDKSFMDGLYILMEKELSNPELNITRMTEVLHISRTKFYYKVKGLTGENPTVFFRTYKLNRAAKLIKEGNKTMSEIADLTGFSTPSHFSSSFKKKFGVSPSEYK